MRCEENLETFSLYTQLTKKDLQSLLTLAANHRCTLQHLIFLPEHLQDLILYQWKRIHSTKMQSTRFVIRNLNPHEDFTDMCNIVMNLEKTGILGGVELLVYFGKNTQI